MNERDRARRSDLPKMARRSFLKLIGGATGGLAVGTMFSPLGMGPTFAQSQTRKYVRRHHQMRMPRVRSAFAQDALTKFVDPLPIPSVLRPSGKISGIPAYSVRMLQFQQKLHSELPPTPLWGYNGTYLGPTFEVRRGKPIYVQWRNHLPSTHLLPVDPTIHGKVTKPLLRPDTSSLPASLSVVPLLDPAVAVRQRNLTLSELDSAMGSPIIALLGFLF